MDIKENFKGHLSTINHHKMEVMRLCFKVGLYKQGLMHDLSKYSPKEFISGVVFYTGDKSPNTTERLRTGAGFCDAGNEDACKVCCGDVLRQGGGL